MKKFNELKKNKLLKIIFAGLRIFTGFVLVGFILVVCLQRFSDNKISFFKYRMFTVISGSMAPTYNIGDVLISKEVEPKDIKVGDTVTYLGEVGDFKNKVITHGVLKIEKVDGQYFFHTKGEANLVQDPVVHESQIFGVVMYRTILLSLIYKVVATNIGFYLFIILPLLFIIGSEIISTLLAKEDERRSKLK